MNNLPVFPSQYLLPENQGMTLRDYFASKAMQGLIASPRMPAPAAFSGSDVTDFMVAELAYKMADAMLKVRDA
jgi:hypothetical protein